MYFFEVPGDVVEAASEGSGVVESCCVLSVDSILEMLQIFFVCITHIKIINDKCEGYLSFVVFLQPLCFCLFVTIFFEVVS